MTKFQNAYFKWVSLRHLVVDAIEARDISSDHWRLRQDAWDEYCEARDESLPKKDHEVVRRIYRLTSKGERRDLDEPRRIDAS